MEASTAESVGARVPPSRATAADAPVGGPAAYAAELVGTFILVLAIVLVLSVGAPQPDGLGFNDFAVIGLVHLIALLVLIHSLAGTSGAHFNPAITIALAARRKISPPDAAIYIVVQLIGAILAALLAKALVGDAADAVKVGAVGVAEGRFLEGSVGKGLIAEFIGTFLLTWAVMATMVDPRGNRSWAGFVVGAALCLGIMTIGPMTGGGFNPARAFGPGLVGDFVGGFGDFLLAFTLGPILGALAAAFAYTAIVLEPQGRADD